MPHDSVLSTLLLGLALATSLVQTKAVVKISGDEVTAVLGEMRDADANRAGKEDVRTDYQNMASHAHFDHDNAPEPFIASVSNNFVSKPTVALYSNLQALYKSADVNTVEDISPEKNASIKLFLNGIQTTGPYRAMLKFLQSKDDTWIEPDYLSKILFDLWFTPYSRHGSVGSSGFESVFVGEIEEEKVVGLNYWYRYYLLEKNEEINYHGWFDHKGMTQATIQFAWHQNEARIDSFLLGTSPEFDFCAYTLCAISGNEECQYSEGDEQITLMVQTVTSASGSKHIDLASPKHAGRGHSTPPPEPETENPHHGGGGSGSLQKVFDQMRAADTERPKDVDITLNWQQEVHGVSDVAHEHFISKVNESIFSIKQYNHLISIYNSDVFIPQVCEEEVPMDGFKHKYCLRLLDTFTNTTMFKHAYNYLKAEGKAADWDSFYWKLYILWFGTYSRCNGVRGSSGFEHVFCGEFKQSKVDGHHSWVNFYLNEKAGKINYHGYYKKDKNLTGTIQYTWGKYLKKTGGFMIQTSPAFDFSMLTICAMAHKGPNACRFEIDGFPLSVTSYTQKCSGGGTCLSTAYPSCM